MCLTQTFAVPSLPPLPARSPAPRDSLDRHAVQARDARGCPVREPGSRCAPAKRPVKGSVLLGDLFPWALAPNGLRLRWCLTSVAPHFCRRLRPGDDDGRDLEGGVIKGGPLQRAHGGGGARGGGEEGQRPSRYGRLVKTYPCRNVETTRLGCASRPYRAAWLGLGLR